MSEEDYQRGRRGGDYRVGCDWDDWKAGRDDLERENSEAERLRERQLDRELALAADGRTANDLGQFKCPHCLQMSLIDGASRCPLCRGRIRENYWSRAHAEQDAKEAARLEREAIEREREDEYWAELSREDAERTRNERKKQAWLRLPQGFLAGGLLGGLIVGLLGLVSCARNLSEAFNTPGFIVKGFNLITGAFYGAIGGALIGLLIAVIANGVIAGREEE